MKNIARTMKSFVASLVVFLGFLPLARAASSVTLDWDAVTTNADGTSITDLQKYRLFQATNASLLGKTTVQAQGDSTIVKTDIAAPALTTTVSGLNPNNTYYFRLTALDASGNQSAFNTDDLGADVEVSTFIPPDLIAPTVSITAPAAGTVSGTITISASASDNVAVATVTFYVDGVAIGSDTTSPYSISWDTKLGGNVSHVLTAVAKDSSNNSTTSAAVNVTAQNDLTAPTVSITAPAAGTVSGTVNITVSASDNSGTVSGVQYKLGNTLLGPEITAGGSFTYSWNTTLTANNTYNLTATARDPSGNVATSAGVSVQVLNIETVPPVVTLTSPANGATVGGGSVALAATATDNVAVASVTFLVDGSPVNTDLSSPYSFSWSLSGVSNGSHQIAARAADNSGNVAVTPAITVTVDNAAPVISGVAASSITTTSAIISWQTNEASDSQVVYGLTSSYGSASAVSGSLVTSHSVLISGLSGAKTYHFQVKSTDGVGNLASSSDGTFNTPKQGPKVKLSASTLAGTVYLNGDVVVVEADVTPGSGNLSSVQLLHTSVNGTTYSSPATMKLVSAGHYAYWIDTLGLNGTAGTVQYYVSVMDDQGLSDQTAPVAFTMNAAVDVAPSGDNVTFATNDGNPYDGEVKVQMPKNSGVSLLNIKRLPPVLDTLKATADDKEVDLSHGAAPVAALDLTVPGKDHMVFNQAVTIVLTYNDLDDVNNDGIPEGDGIVDGTNIPAKDLRVFWHDGDRWRLIGGIVDPAKHTVTAKVMHFSEYALFPSAASSVSKAPQKFLSPSKVDGHNDFATFGIDAIDVTVLDVNGHRVFHASQAETGNTAITWNCRDEAGNIVPSGVYVAKIKLATGKILYQSLAVVK